MRVLKPTKLKFPPVKKTNGWSNNFTKLKVNFKILQ